MEKCYVFRKELSNEEVIEIYKKAIEENPKFDSEIDEKLITITEGFLVYPFIDGNIKNLEYLVLKGKKQQSGVIDASCHLVSKDFLLYEHSKKEFVEEEHPISDYNVFNLAEVEVYQKDFIKRILEKTTDTICKRHNVILTDHDNYIDISPIKTFENYEIQYYLEEVYFIDYFSKHHRKPFKSLYSTLLNQFYTLDYVKSSEYQLFYKSYKHPIVYIPKMFLEDYYTICFQIYLMTIEELKFMKPSELYYKLKKNIKYKEYSKYEEYLMQLIFYFKKTIYLKELKPLGTSLKQKILYSYLTLKFNPQSGYDLANLVLNHVLQDNYLKLYDISTKLGNTLAKKALYEHYSNPRSYNAYYHKRYS